MIASKGTKFGRITKKQEQDIKLCLIMSIVNFQLCYHRNFILIFLIESEKHMIEKTHSFIYPLFVLAKSSF